MERKQMEVDFLIKSLGEFIDDNAADGNKGEFAKNNKKVQLSHEAKPSRAFSSAKSENGKQQFSKLLEMNKDNILRGIIFSEVLGSPRARRRR